MGKKGDKMTSESGKSAEKIQSSLAGLGEIRLKKMFGGYGIFEMDKMFALVDSQGGVFFKVDETNKAEYEAAGVEKHGRMPYYRVPDAVLADDTTLAAWAKISIQISKG